MSKRSIMRTGKLLLAAIACGVSVQAHAVTYDIVQQVTGNEEQVSKVATLEVVQVGQDARFTLTGSFGYLSSNSFIKEIHFTGDGGEFVAGSGNTILDAPMTAFFSGGIDNTGVAFNWRVRFPTAGNGDRFGANDVASWTIRGASADSFANPMVKLNGGTGGIVKVAALSAAPEADTWLLFLAGLGVLGLGSRRRIR